MNERKTEQLVRQHLEALGYNAPSVIVEEQSSDNKQIRGLLKGASKHDGGGIGSPEFLITSGLLPDFVVVYECKADPIAAYTRTSSAVRRATQKCLGLLLRQRPPRTMTRG